MPRAVKRQHRQWLLATSMLLLVWSCTYWEPYPAPSPGKQQRLPSSLRVTPAGGYKTLLVEPYLRSDTLFGRSAGDTLKFPLEHLQLLERQWVDGLRTTGLILGTTALWIVVGLYGGGLE